MIFNENYNEELNNLPNLIEFLRFPYYYGNKKIDIINE